MVQSKFAEIVLPEEFPTDVTLNNKTLFDLEMIFTGGFAPLTGFFTYNEFCSVVEKCYLPTGELWPLPVLLPVAKSLIKVNSSNVENIEPQTKRSRATVNLRDDMNTIIAELDVTDCFQITDLDSVAKLLLGSADVAHPYKKYLKSLEPCVFLGGKVKKQHDIIHFDFVDFRLTAEQTKKMIAAEKWKHVLAFQTRNPMHRSHFHLTLQAAKQVSDQNNGEKVNILISPVVGPTQGEDVPYHIRVRCYKHLLKYYIEYAKQHGYLGEVKLVLIPLFMRMAGPRECLMHSLIRKNYGCTHFVVGRDHAGPSVVKEDGSKFYGDYEAHDFVKQFEKKIGINLVFLNNIVYVKPLKSAAQLECASQAESTISTQEKAHTDDDEGTFIQETEFNPKTMEKYTISGTNFRKMLQNHEPVPHWYSYPELISELQCHYKPYHQLGFCVYFTGLPCSGKTSLAQATHALLMERQSESRNIIFLDADILRKELCKGLGFDRESRQTHVRRIGYVASLIVQSGAICLVANIAPYKEDRDYNRALITATGGGYIEVYLCTPLQVCEKRDIKGHYKRARLGIVQNFTGVSNPYEVPENPEMSIDSSGNIIEKSKMVLDYLQKHKWVC